MVPGRVCVYDCACACACACACVVPYVMQGQHVLGVQINFKCSAAGKNSKKVSFLVVLHNQYCADVREFLLGVPLGVGLAVTVKSSLHPEDR